MNRLLTPDEVCKRYGIKINTLYSWTSENTIPHIKRGGLRFREADLNKWDEESFTGEPTLKLI